MNTNLKPTGKMKKYEVVVWFKDQTLYVCAKSETDAKKKAYAKAKKKVKIDKQLTIVNS